MVLCLFQILVLETKYLLMIFSEGKMYILLLLHGSTETLTHQSNSLILILMEEIAIRHLPVTILLLTRMDQLDSNMQISYKMVIN